MSATATDTIYDTIEDAARNLYIKALKDIPKDVRAALRNGYDAEMRAGQETASKVMLTVLKNIELADERDMMVCQDTGLPVYKLIVGNRINLDLAEVKARLRTACERATRDYPL